MEVAKRKATWAEVSEGETVWIDNYQDGKYPQANPRISGPYTVISRHYRTLRTQWGWVPERTFMHYPNNLLVEDTITSPRT